MGRKAAQRVKAAESAIKPGEIHVDDSDVDSNEDEEATSTYENAANLPAHQTKHLAELIYHFPSINTTFLIRQRNDTDSTGSSLWLSSQVLSSYLLHTYAGKSQPNDGQQTRKRVLELGSGTGLLLLLMARLGWQAIATDIPPVLDTVLEPNVEAGLYQLINEGIAEPDQARVSELDWTVPPEKWYWHPSLRYPSTTAFEHSSTSSDHQCEQRFDLILTADTIYEPSIIRPLMSTIAHLYERQEGLKPTVLLALERRDPVHITEALNIAKEEYGLSFKQIPVKRVRKIFDALGDGAAWSRDDWEGVEIWKL